MNAALIAARLAEARVARLATLGAAGAPVVVPFCFAVEDDRLYSAVDHKPKRTPRLGRLANVGRDPRVCVLVDHYEEDWGRLWWIRLDGVARELDPAHPESAHALDLLAAKYPQYRERRPAGPVLRIDITRRRAWSGQAGPDTSNPIG
jgi:PPOX class probable F420-dependent enzyme